MPEDVQPVRGGPKSRAAHLGPPKVGPSWGGTAGWDLRLGQVMAVGSQRICGLSERASSLILQRAIRGIRKGPVLKNLFSEPGYCIQGLTGEYGRIWKHKRAALMLGNPSWVLSCDDKGFFVVVVFLISF